MLGLELIKYNGRTCDPFFINIEYIQHLLSSLINTSEFVKLNDVELKLFNLFVESNFKKSLVPLNVLISTIVAGAFKIILSNLSNWMSLAKSRKFVKQLHLFLISSPISNR